MTGTGSNAGLGFDVRRGDRSDAPRLVLIHGFTQTRSSWDRLRRDLGGDIETIAVDAPGHGESAAARLDLDGGASAIAAAGGRGTYVGYSMGGRFALHAAFAHPQLVERLVLISATAGIDDADDRATRRRSDETLAATIEQDGVPAFLDRWLALPLFATLPAEAAGRAARESNTAPGLASSLRLAGTGTQQPLWDRLGELTMPVLLVAGALDGKFLATAERMAALIPHADLQVVERAGHTVHLEQPDAFAEMLLDWLRRAP